MSDHNIFFENEAYAEDLYESWMDDPESVPADWRSYFETIEVSPGETARTGGAGNAQGRVNSLIWGYRDVGYLYARLNPLVGYLAADLLYLHKQDEGLYERLTLREFDLSEENLDEQFTTGGYFDRKRATLREIVALLRETYCSSIGVEFLHIQNKPMRTWIIDKMESSRGKMRLTDERRLRILSDLVQSEQFEHFLHTTYIGQKRFSLEGSEVLIPALHFFVDTAVESGVEDIVIGMSHRGRLDVLLKILNEPAEEIFSEFEDVIDPELYGGAGDVKYHRGYQSDHVHENGQRIGITLVPNSSHLESVDPIVEGMARGIQAKKHDDDRKKVIPLLIHGDGAFSAQGMAAETLNLSQLNGYTTGGTVHLVVNNQIGFTTSTRDARSTFFPTDVGKMLPIPIFHVNGDDPEAVIFVTDLAFQFRQLFGSDVIVDIFCYRKYGHNEGDEPSFTHPRMYHHIKYHDSVAKIYGDHLIGRKLLTAQELKDMADSERASLKQALGRIKSDEKAERGKKGKERAVRNPGVSIVAGTVLPAAAPEKPTETGETGVPRETLKRIVERITAVPDGFNIHSKLERIVKGRAKRFEEGSSIDFALAETLAFGTLLLERVTVRLSGEDSARGTFSQRHTVWWDTESSRPYSYIPLNSISDDQARLLVYDSPLSELSVLGFEYGYALARPEALVIWEAQYGDFCNGAQVIIDNYVASGEKKWQSACGVVMLLPHGYEGQGPDHSTAHVERFLHLCGEDNMQVCNVTTPAQYFHLLRSHAKRKPVRPLIIFTPKSLLRAKAAVSPVDELSKGAFARVIDDPDAEKTASTLCFCSGKIYYELQEEKAERTTSGPALVRVEQLFPFPQAEIEAVMKKYSRHSRLAWVQEEPMNRGAWTYIQERFTLVAEPGSLKYIGRAESASSATGSHRLHRIEQNTLIDRVFDYAAGEEGAGSPRAGTSTGAEKGAGKKNPARQHK